MGIVKELYKTFFKKDDSGPWRQFAKEQNGKYTPVSDHKIEFQHKNFTLTFDAYTHYIVAGGRTSDSDYTRGILEYKNSDEFRLSITEQGFFENIGKLFGVMDIEIGVRSFDKKFMIKSNDVTKTQLFLSNDALTSALENLPIIRFEITNGSGLWDEQPKQGNFMLYVVMEGRIKQPDQLNQFLELFSAAIDQLN